MFQTTFLNERNFCNAKIKLTQPQGNTKPLQSNSEKVIGNILKKVQNSQQHSFNEHHYHLKLGYAHIHMKQRKKIFTHLNVSK